MILYLYLCKSKYNIKQNIEYISSIDRNSLAIISLWRENKNLVILIRMHLLQEI